MEAGSYQHGLELEVLHVNDASIGGIYITFNSRLEVRIWYSSPATYDVQARYTSTHFDSIIPRNSIPGPHHTMKRSLAFIVE